MKKILIAIAAMLCTLSANAQSYKVGDLYDKDGLQGLVVRVDDSGEHGLIMSLTKCTKKWLDGGDEKFSTNAFYEDDGEKNMAIIETYIKENGKSWSMFPYFEWCRSLGEGWYAPAADELRDILIAINGGEGKYDAKFMKKISKVLKKANGDDLIDSGFAGTKNPHQMYSSTEGDNGKVYTLWFTENLASSMLGGGLGGTKKGKFEITLMSKTFTGGKVLNTYGSRAVHKF